MTLKNLFEVVDAKGERDPEWMKFQREWLRPAITGSKMREIWNE